MQKTRPPSPVTGKARGLGGRVKSPRGQAVHNPTRVHAKLHQTGLDPSDTSLLKRGGSRLYNSYTPFFHNLILECIEEVLIEKGLLQKLQEI